MAPQGRIQVLRITNVPTGLTMLNYYQPDARSVGVVSQWGRFSRLKCTLILHIRDILRFDGSH